MNWKTVFPLFLLFCIPAAGASDGQAEKKIGLEDIRTLVQQNRSVIIESLNSQIADEEIEQSKSARLPELRLDGDGYYSNRIPLAKGQPTSNSFLYHFNIRTEYDIYTGGMHKRAIELMQKEKQISQERLEAVQEEVTLQGYVLMYDIYRNIKYLDFIRSSIHLREKEYERIGQLYQNGLVLKSDLLRSKLYITDLQKDQIAVENSISILSDELCVLLGITEDYAIVPTLADDLDYQLSESFEELFHHAQLHSPVLGMRHFSVEKEELALDEIKGTKRPHLKLYAQYGVGSPNQLASYHHQAGGEVGAKITFDIGAFYKNRYKQKAQKSRISQEQLVLDNEEAELRSTLHELYTRYNESLINIDRAIEKIAMSEESARILHNSYYNQQALLIDVLESETQSMQASFEWIEAVVDSQKYYWALKQICGYL